MQLPGNSHPNPTMKHPSIASSRRPVCPGAVSTCTFRIRKICFGYLVQGYLDQMTMVLEEALVRQGGDVFAALL